MDRDAILAAIARQQLGFETLETRNSDSLDFRDVSAAGVKAALEAAFHAGVAAATIPNRAAFLELYQAFATGSYGTRRQAKALRRAAKALGVEGR